MAKKKAKRKNFPKPTAGPKGPEKKFWEKIPAPLLPAKDEFLGWLCLIGIIALAFLLSFHTLTDTDIFHHLKTGEIIWATHQVPQEDSFSFTMSGREWINAPWLFQVIIYALYRIAGTAGMIVFGSALSAATWALIMAPIYQRNKYFLITLLGFICLVSAGFRLKLRPELLSFFFLALEMFLLRQYQLGKKYALFPLPILLLFWLNSEGLWPIYFVVLGGFLAEELLFLLPVRADRYFKSSAGLPARQAATGLSLCLALSLPLTLINPYGYRGAIFPWQLFQHISSGQSYIRKTIFELQSPFYSGFSWFYRVPYLVLLVFSTPLVVFYGLKRRMYPAALLLWAIFLLLSLSAIRNVALFAMVTAFLIGRVISEPTEPESPGWERLKGHLLLLRPLGAIMILLAMIWLTVDITTSNFFIRNGSFSRFGVGALETDYPIRGSEFLKSISAGLGKKRELKIFSDLENAGYLIWTGYPAWKVYIDPRLDVYGEQMIESYMASLQHPQAFAGEDAKYGFEVVVTGSFLRRKNFILSLYNNPDWALVYFDGLDVIFLKNRPEFSQAIRNYRIDLSRGYSSPLPRGLGGSWLARERLYRGYLLLILGYPELAARELSAGIALDPKEANLNYYLGLAYNRLGQPERARRYWEKLAEQYPDSVKALTPLAKTYLMLGETERAMAIFKRILQRNPKEINSCMDLALIYEEIQGEPVPGYQQWQRCLEIYQSNPQEFPSQAEAISQALKRLEPPR